MKQLLERYVGGEIGLNLTRPLEFDVVPLVGVAGDYFTVQTPRGQLAHFPYRVVTNVVDGGTFQVRVGAFKKPAEVPALVQVYHFTMLKSSGGVGFGIAF